MIKAFHRPLFLNRLAEDLQNYDKNNDSERKVLEAHYFSAYKGKLVLRTNLRRSGSFGILLISRWAEKRRAPEDEVRHEYGHTKQLDQLGAFRYLFCIGLPSFFQWGTDPEYYRRPWEITADLYGGVKSRQYPGYQKAGFDYLKKSRKSGLLVWFTIE